MTVSRLIGAHHLVPLLNVVAYNSHLLWKVSVILAFSRELPINTGTLCVVGGKSPSGPERLKSPGANTSLEKG